jgi:carboxymethylenebutenolidase
MRHALLLSLVVACSSPPTKPNPPTTTGPASTGPLTEAQFKAMHELPPESAPAPKGETVELAGGSKAYLSLPAGPGPHPGIIVIHEWWGLNGHIKHWADRLASTGYAALAVDLYGVVATDKDAAMAAMKVVDNTKAMAVIRAGLDFLTNDPRTKSSVQAVIGWCFGGGWSCGPRSTARCRRCDRLLRPPRERPGEARDDQARSSVFGNQDRHSTADVDKFEAR